MSLRARIRLLVLGATVAVVVLFATPLVLLLRQAATEEVRRAAVDQAQGVADYVSAVADDGLDPTVLASYLDRANARDDAPPTQVLLPGGDVVGAAMPALEEGGSGGGRTPEDDDGDGDGYDGLMPTSPVEASTTDGGELAHVHVSTSDGEVVVVAYARDEEVNEVVGGRLVALAAAGVVALLLAAVASEVLTRRIVRQLGEAAATADRISDGDLDARAPVRGPDEVRRVAVALNRLAGRIDDLLTAERETVADLSHRLRTPLTAVRLDVEALAASPGKADLERHLDQLERTLSAVIRAARRPQREGVLPQCDVRAVLQERAAFWGPLAEDQEREFTVDAGSAELLARCGEADLAAAVDALLENAIAHTSEGVPIRVRLAAGPPVVVEVADRGPGIPPDAVLRGRSDRGSTGLGLDIARSCAEASGGALQIDRRDGWSVVRLVLGHLDVDAPRAPTA